MSARAALPPLVLALHHTPRHATWSPLGIGAGPLRSLLRKLLERGYRFLPLDAVGPEGPPPGAALLTVDDGYVSTWSTLAPLARELGIPWSVFLLVGAVGTRNDWDLHGVSLPERHLREGEIAALAGEGVGIGSHGMNHIDLTRLGASALAEELSESRAWLERATGRRVEAFSYPWGRVDTRVATAARAAGYRLGFSLRRARSAERADRAVPGLAIARLALYAPDQIPGLFEATALRAPRAGRILREGAGAIGGWLVARALSAAGRAHA